VFARAIGPGRSGFLRGPELQVESSAEQQEALNQSALGLKMGLVLVARSGESIGKSHIHTRARLVSAVGI
jgi:hypothetical protein